MRSEWDRLGDNRSGIGLGAEEGLDSNWWTPGSLIRTCACKYVNEIGMG